MRRYADRKAARTQEITALKEAQKILEDASAPHDFFVLYLSAFFCYGYLLASLVASICGLRCTRDASQRAEE